jgi:hypothetical protein
MNRVNKSDDNFVYDFDFNTMVDTDGMPISKCMRLRISRVDNTLIVIENDSGRHTHKMHCFIGISESGRPVVEVQTSVRDHNGNAIPETLKKLLAIELNEDGTHEPA